MHTFRPASLLPVLTTAVVMLLGVGLLAAQDASEARREQTLQELLRILTPSRSPHAGRINAQDNTWEEWQRRTAELPPDFARMPSQPFLPDPLAAVPEENIPAVHDAASWQQKRAWIAAQAQQWFYGSVPPAPTNLTAEIISSTKDGDLMLEQVMLSFGPDLRGRLLLEVVTPPGPGPFPVFLTNHPRWRPWISTAVRRGYIGVFYSASDPNYSIRDYSDEYIDVYPQHDFSTIARWGWAASRAVDYLFTLPKVNRAQIGITGHSRNGKQALMAAAFDERIGAVILSSGNTGEATPWRFTPDIYSNETLEQITTTFPHWFHPRLRFFAGREHKLPIDQNSIISMVAPRGLLIASAYSEGQGAPYGIEQGYRSAQGVYRLLGAEDKIALHLRAGEHATTAGDIERYVDFLDHVFGRPAALRPDALTLDYQHPRWQSLAIQAGAANAFHTLAPVRLQPDQWPAQRPRVRAALQALFGEEPAGLSFGLPPSGEASRYPNDGWLSGLFGRPIQGESFTWQPVGFGDDLRADLYRPVGAPPEARLPVLIWLHQDAHPTGYSRYFKPWLQQAIDKGFAVLVFDQIGYGSRIHEAREFYRRYPRWSLMGKMVADARAAVDIASRLPGLDANRIALAGWSVGARVAMYAAALEPRVRAVAMHAGFRPQRPANDAQAARELAETEGLAQYGRLQGLLPQWDAFSTRPNDLPIDDPEVLALLSPRPVLVIAPQRDRYAAPSLVRATISRVRQVYAREQAADALTFEAPLDFNRFPAPTQSLLFEWLRHALPPALQAR
ncbi:MAG: acetylxylan esterase [Bryobacterales bacterium]|jgi:dienelactone hydrolase|nr:acetylxylan esterase [Bryobacterales bacterium]